MIDVAIVLGSIGFDQIVKNPPVDKYNASTIRYAKMSIQKMNNGAKSKNWGAFGIYEYKTKENALAWMNYIVGMIKYHRDGKANPSVKKESLMYLYKSTKYNSDRKKEPRTYGSIGDWYRAEAVALGKKRDVTQGEAKALIDKRNAAEEKTEQDSLDAQIDAIEAKMLRSVALEKAYVDRAIDAYARAYQYAKANPKESKTYVDGLRNTINGLYNFRYQKPEKKTPAIINTYLAGVMSTPMPDPTSQVSPVVEPTMTDDKATDADSGAGRSRTVTTSNR